MNVPEALHCMGCGAELGVTAVLSENTASWPCPRCLTRTLEAFACADGTFYDCVGCGGQFLPHGVLQSMVRRHQSAPINVGGRLRPLNPMKERITYLACPSCRELMHRRNFGLISGVIVDVCAVHGNWFDVGELARILAFVGQGGLERGQTARTDVPAGSGRTLASGGGYAAEPASSAELTWEDMREAGIAFARWVQTVFHR